MFLHSATLVIFATTIGQAGSPPPAQPAMEKQPIDLSKIPTGTPGRLSGVEAEILAKIKATPVQILSISNRQDEATRKFNEIQSDYRQDKDTARMLGRQLEVMKWSRAETRKILGDEKYSAYQKLWDEQMKPALDNGKKNA